MRGYATFNYIHNNFFQQNDWNAHVRVYAFCPEANNARALVMGEIFNAHV
jgi:hypothetical protein